MTRGVKRRATYATFKNEPPGKKKKQSPPRWTMENSKKDIPVPLRARKVKGFYVEILDLDAINLKDPTHLNKEGLRNNHCIIRLLFSHPSFTEEEEPSATFGVTLDLEYKGPGPASTAPGQFFIKIANHSTHHPFALKVIEIPIKHGKKGKRLKDFLEVIENNNLLPCGFNIENEGAVGCKDFVSQYIQRLEECNILTVDPTIYATFNDNYGPSAEKRDGSVGYAAFNQVYHGRHLNINGVRYTGNRLQLGS